MGVFDFIKSGVREMMIARPDNMKHLICFKHPDQNFPMYSQLTVDSDEAAVFFKDGRVVGVLPPGRHTLQTQNIPFLNNIVNKFTGGDVFIAEIFFVKMSPVLGLRFGGELEPMEDPVLFVSVSPQCHGEFALRVADPVRFVVGYHGQAASRIPDNDAILGWIKGKFFMSVKDGIAQVLMEKQKSMLNFAGLNEEFRQRILQRSPSCEEIGVQITDIGYFKVGLKDEDTQFLRQENAERAKAERGVNIAAKQAQANQFGLDQKYNQDARYVQNLAGNWQNYAAGQAIMGAGEGMREHGVGGGIAGLGAEVAIGANVGGAMAGAFANQPQFQVAPPQQPPQQAPQPQAAPGAVAVCPKCSARQPQGKFCQECGTSLAPQKKFCTGCSQELIPPTVKFCGNCGTPSAAPTQASGA
ncbi:SPFH domain-containing protein [Pendulispora rubella]|uniref:SPFH domain-containing protein n=1 Tax=Pendulispora rubella TaxID=2741070 RepID=A0ABZ2LCQ2_9BACT